MFQVIQNQDICIFKGSDTKENACAVILIVPNQLSFIFETEAELATLPNWSISPANLPNLPNSVKTKNPLNISIFKIYFYLEMS